MPPVRKTITKQPFTGRILALIGIIAVAFNLRSAVASLSPLINQINSDFPLTPTFIVIIGSLPPVCYVIFGALTPSLTQKFNLELTLVLALLLIAIGQLGRGVVNNDAGLFVVDTMAFAGIGIGNVLLPPLVKRYFPDRIGLITTLYVVAFSLSTFIPPLLAVPLAEVFNWRISLAVWGVVATIALIPWVPLLAAARRKHRAVELSSTIETKPSFALLARTPLVWALTAMFGSSGFLAYSSFACLPAILKDTAGVSESDAGALLGLFALLGLPTSLVVPLIAHRFGLIRTMVTLSVLVQITGTLGLLFWPTQATLLWVVLLGTAPLTFPLVLILINMRTITNAGSVALSGFIQSVGYLVAAAGPILVGLLHSETGNWQAALWCLLTSVILTAIGGFYAARPQILEDELERHHP